MHKCERDGRAGNILEIQAAEYMRNLSDAYGERSRWKKVEEIPPSHNFNTHLFLYKQKYNNNKSILIIVDKF